MTSEQQKPTRLPASASAAGGPRAPKSFESSTAANGDARPPDVGWRPPPPPPPQPLTRPFDSSALDEPIGNNPACFVNSVNSKSPAVRSRKSALIDDSGDTDEDTFKSKMSDLPSYEMAASGSIFAHNTKFLDDAQPSAPPMMMAPPGVGFVYDKSCSYPPPPMAGAANANGNANTSNANSFLQCDQSDQFQNFASRDGPLEPIGEEEMIMQMTQAMINSQPPRSKRNEVLRYFSGAKTFLIRVLGSDIQVTDTDGCPLFDAYVELDCRNRWWNVEAYGDPVLLMREELNMRRRRRAYTTLPVLKITDWNGEPLGYLCAGDPMRLESPERAVLGRLFSQPAMLSNSASGNLGALPKACWICQAGGEDCRERQVARLEAYRRIVFADDHAPNQTLSFHLKLMILAAIIRLVGGLTLTPVTDCLSLTKFFLNCCAYK